jgi:hypothetical protein
MAKDIKQRFGAITWSKIAIGVLAAGAALYLLAGHEAHALVVLPYLLLLACPLMHLMMHRGHGGASHGSHRDEGHATTDLPRDPSSP